MTTLFKIRPYNVSNRDILLKYLLDENIPRSSYKRYGSKQSAVLDNIIFFNENDALVAKLKLPFLVAEK